MQNKSDSQFDQFICLEINEYTIGTSSLDIDAQWEKMDIALSKNNFFKFKLSKFNIYYLSAIIAGILGTYFLLNSPRINSTERTKEILVPVSSGGLESITGKEERRNTNKPDKKIFSKKVAVISTDTSDSALSNVENADDDNANMQSQFSIQQKPDSILIVTSPLPKKIKYVVKRDTVITYDTTKIKRRR